MTNTFRNLIATSFALAALLVGTSPAKADVSVTFDANATWLGFMNWFELDRSGSLPAPTGGVLGGGSWGVPDTTALINATANNVTLGPNAIADPNPYWYVDGGGPGQLGNKWMDANTYVQVDDTYAGMNVTFAGFVASNSFTANHTGTAFIRDFAADFSSFTDETVELDEGFFSITLATDPGVGRHVQYGFNVQGENVWVTDVAPFGTAVVTAIPEPSSMALLMLGATGMVVRRRRS